MEQPCNGMGEWEMDIASGIVKAEALVRIVLAERGVDFEEIVSAASAARQDGCLELEEDGDDMTALVVNHVLKSLRRGELFDLNFLTPRKNGVDTGERHRKKKDVRAKDRAKGTRFSAFFSNGRAGEEIYRGTKRGESIALGLESLHALDTDASVTPDAP